MANEGIATLVALLRENNPMAGGTIEEMRANMLAGAAAAPLPEDVRYEPIEIGGVCAEWTMAPGAAEDRALLYFHGGGYTIGGIETHRPVVSDLSRAAGMRVLSLAYRLAPEHPFPAAVDDAVAAYRHLLELGFAASKLAIGGDSAGGGLTAATLLALRDAGDPLPAMAVCISPWLDLTQTAETFESRAAEDPMVTKAMLDMMSAAYLGGAEARQPLASPLFADLAGLPPLLIHVGTAEVLLDDARHFASRARDAGVEVELDVWQDMIHVWHCFGLVLPEANDAIARIGEALKKRIG